MSNQSKQTNDKNELKKKKRIEYGYHHLSLFSQWKNKILRAISFALFVIEKNQSELKIFFFS
jgi:hypothetical protein